MQRKEKRIVPAHEEEFIVETTCDSCGTKKRDTNYGDNWGKTQYDVDEVTIERRTGCQYPEGGSGKKIVFDICPKCMDEKVVPFLESIGVKPRIQDWES